MCKMQCVDPSQRWYTDITYKSQYLIGRSVLDRKRWLYGKSNSHSPGQTAKTLAG